MVLTTRTGRTLRLSFIHSSHDGKTREGAGELRAEIDAAAAFAGRRLTVCQICEVFSTGDGEADSHESVEHQLLGEGISICHPNDTFNKAVGRKLALTYALDAVFPTNPEIVDDNTRYAHRQERTDVWGAYRALSAPVLIDPVTDWFSEEILTQLATLRQELEEDGTRTGGLIGSYGSPTGEPIQINDLNPPPTNPPQPTA